MDWKDVREPGDDRFKGRIELHNDKRQKLAGICWFDDDGPFYAHSVDLTEPDTIRRIGPISTIESAKQRCLDVVEGRLDVRDRAGYPRS